MTFKKASLRGTKQSLHRTGKHHKAQLKDNAARRRRFLSEPEFSEFTNFQNSINGNAFLNTIEK